jgi:DNA-binding PadR family transcriptional regulator
MSLKHAILGFLNYGPQSGYDLKKAFDASIQHFWPADQSQIYRTLARLADAGYAEVEVEVQDDRPDRKVYQITPDGKKELHRWLTNPLPPRAFRSAELIQVFFAGNLSNEEALAIFEREAEKLRQILEQYEQVSKTRESHHYLEAISLERKVFFWGLTLENGLWSTRSDLEWVESVIDRIKNNQIPS